MAGLFIFVMNIQDQKKELRKKILSLRKSLSPEKVFQKSIAIQKKLLKTQKWQQSHKIALYSPTQNEVDTKQLLMKALEQTKMVFFPRVEKELNFYQVNHPDQLIKGAWGILEPKPECTAHKESFDLMVIPGVAFDDEGRRLGFGSGLYDRYLSRFQQVKETAFLCALIFEFQRIPKLPTESWDLQTNQIITEKQIYSIKE